MFMRNLENVELTKEQYHYMKRRVYDYGTEATLYSEPSIFGMGTVAKIFNDSDKTIIQNKFLKIHQLYQLEDLEKINDIHILKSISYQRKIIGYLMNRTHYRDISFVSDQTQILYYLLKGRQKLKQMQELGILYGDISISNLMVYGNDVCFCDLDNVSYQGFKMDMVSEFLEEFICNYGEVDEKLHSYMYNLLTIRMLCSLDETSLVKDYFEEEQIPEELLPRYYLYIRKQMQFVTPKYDDIYFIDYVKEKVKQKAMTFGFGSNPC